MNRRTWRSGKGRKVACAVIAACGVFPPASWAAERITLADAYRRMIRDSPVLKLAMNDVEDAHLLHREAWLQLGPFLTLTGQALHGVPVGFSREGNYLTQSSVLLQPLFRRSLWPALSATEFQEESAQMTVGRVKQQLMFLLVDTMLKVDLARKLRVLADASVKRTDAQLTYASARVKAGGALRTTELLASTELKRAQANLVSARRDMDVAEDAYRLIVREPPPPELLFPTTPRPQALAEALRKVAERADLKALRHTVDQKDAQVDQAAALPLWPTLDLRASGSDVEASYALPKDPNNSAAGTVPPWAFDANYLWQVGAVLTVPVFQGGQEFVEVQRRRVDFDRAKNNLENVTRSALNDVRQAFDRLEAARSAVQVAEERDRLAQENYSLTTTQFKLGAITFLEVATAQTALSDAEAAHVQAANDREHAAYELLFATGELDLESLP